MSRLSADLKKFANDGFKLSSQDFSVNPTLNIEGRVYQLYACVCHHGYSSRSGHYTAYCQYDNKWFHFNDERYLERHLSLTVVSLIAFTCDRVKDVTDTFSASRLTDAYVLFYKSQSSNYSSRLWVLSNHALTDFFVSDLRTNHNFFCRTYHFKSWKPLQRITN